jgi:hypothetical protein
MGVCIAIALVWARFYRRHHNLAISDAIASLLLRINEPNKADSERTRKDEVVGPIPRLLAQSVSKWRLLYNGGMHRNCSGLGEIL